MTVILVLVTFSIFILLDWAVNRRKAPQAVAASAHTASPLLDQSYVEGFLVPEQLSYHPGHSWAMQERQNLVRIGIDDFAAALAGHVERIELPKTGQWLRQGQKAWSLYRDGEKTAMVSPTEGEVIEINPEVAANPELLRKDPYGNGWLALIHVPDEESTRRNLVPKGLVRVGCGKPWDVCTRCNRSLRARWRRMAVCPPRIYWRACRMLTGGR